MPPKVIYVRWEDACWDPDRWIGADDIDPKFELESVGILVRDDGKYVSFATDRRGNTYRNVHHIPREYIKEMREVRSWR